MGIFDQITQQIANEVNKQISAKMNRKIHEMANKSERNKESGQAPSPQNHYHSNSLSGVETVVEKKDLIIKDPLHIDAFDGIIDREKEHFELFKEQCIEQYRHTYFIDQPFCELIKEHSFEMLDQMPEDLRQSKYFKEKLAEVAEHHMRICCQLYTERKGTVSLIYSFIRELKHFPELDSMISSFLVHDDYFSSECHASRSILNIDLPIKEQFGKIIATGLPDSISKFAIKEMLNLEVLEKKEIQGRKLSDTDVNVFIVSNAMMSDVSDTELDELKQMILYMALIDDRSRDAMDSNFTANYVAMTAFGITTGDEESLILNPGVDFVIADAIRSLKSGHLNEFDERFAEWLEECGGRIARDQYDIFQAVFQEIGAYSSECVLLDFMIQSEIDHTIEQEKRLTFLKDNKTILTQDMEKYAPVSSNIMVSGEDNKQILLYDHRFLSWNTNEIEKYFKGLGLANKKQTVAMVVDKWSKNVTVESRKWNNKIITELLKATIEEEFDTSYEVFDIEAGVVIGDEVDTTPSVYIKATNKARYSEFSFLVIGEPMTKNQVNLSIVVLVTPENEMDSNDKILKRVIAIKEKHNPRLETYIETLKNIVIERMNRWVIEVNGNQDIY